jgi:hypothetical protein
LNNSKSTPHPDDPLDRPIFLGLYDRRPSRYLDDGLTNQLAAAAASCRGGVLSSELIRLLDLAGARICERASSLEVADVEMARVLCWVAVKMGTNGAKWFDGRLYSALDVGLEVPYEQIGEVGGYKGRPARDLREAIYSWFEFARYGVARMRLAERIEKARLDRRPLPEQLREFTERFVGATERIVGAIEKQAPIPQPAPTIPQPTGEEKKAEARAGNSGDAQTAVNLSEPKRRRGRPQTIPPERKERALKKQNELEAQNKKDNRAIARILYDTHHPTTEHSRNVPTILRYYEKNQRSKYLKALAARKQVE